jgi:hypothetical protein
MCGIVEDVPLTGSTLAGRTFDAGQATSVHTSTLSQTHLVYSVLNNPQVIILCCLRQLVDQEHTIMVTGLAVHCQSGVWPDSCISALVGLEWE